MENYNSEREQIAIDYLSGSYFKLSRKIFAQMTSKSSFERRTGWLHMLLIGLCYHTDGVVMLEGRKVSCRKGEYVGSLRQLSEILGFSHATIARLIKKLVSQNLIEVMRLENGTHIRICGYRVIAEARETKPDKPVQPRPITPTQLSEASKKIIMRRIDPSINPDTSFF